LLVFICNIQIYSFQLRDVQRLMHDDGSGRLDLNLLSIFDAIMIEGSLTKAGHRLGITQSAVSHALSRLREITGDTLFERTGRGVRPTPVALAMSENVRSAIDLLRSTLRSPQGAFCPATDNRTFVLDFPAGIDTVLVPRLHQCLKGQTSVRFRIAQGRASGMLSELRYGESWLALDHDAPSAPGFSSKLIMDDPFVLISRKNHLALAKGVTLEIFQDLSHVAFAWAQDWGPTPLSSVLRNLGVVRKVQYAVPSITTLPAMVENSDLVGALPARLARQFDRNYDLAIHPLPDLLPPMSVYMVWHSSFENDPGHAWLRGIVRDVCEAL